MSPSPVSSTQSWFSLNLLHKALLREPVQTKHSSCRPRQSNLKSFICTLYACRNHFAFSLKHDLGHSIARRIRQFVEASSISAKKSFEPFLRDVVFVNHAPFRLPLPALE